MPQNFYEVAWIFIIYAFLGWCTEVSYAALDTGKFVNRGFLNGPYCPIYGCGVVIVVTILTPLRHSLLLLFAGSFLLTSALEYITGFLLEKVFHNKWWDYSDKPFNIKGYVCLKFSVYWGLACTFIMDVLHPMIYGAIRWLPFTFGMILLCIFLCVFVTDCVLTVTTILKFNKRLKIMDEMAASIHRLSDEIGETIYENVAGVIEKSGEFQESHAELIDKLAETTESAKSRIAEGLTETTESARQRIAETTESAKNRIAETAENAKNRIAETAGSIGEKKREYARAVEEKKRERAELMERYEKLYEEKSFGFKRLIKAFPNMKSRDNNETLEKFKLHFNTRKKEKTDGEGENNDQNS